MAIVIYVAGLVIGTFLTASGMGNPNIIAAFIVWGVIWSVLYGLALLGWNVGRASANLNKEND